MWHIDGSGAELLQVAGRRCLELRRILSQVYADTFSAQFTMP